MTFLQIGGGFILLLGGAEILVRGSLTMAHRLGVPPLIIGMTVVALGTSAPELVVSLNAALSDSAALAIGNVVGSNVANILLILGVAALVSPIAQRPDAHLHDGIVLLAGSLLFTGLCFFGTIGLGSGLVLLAFFFAFLGHAYWRGKSGHGESALTHLDEVAELEGHEPSLGLAWALVGVGLFGVIYGADILVEGSVSVARDLGVPEEIIGLTLVAIGTSLPELAASVMAAVRGHADMALGNVVGSNLFNVVGIVGTVAVVTPLAIPAQVLDFDLWVMMAATVVLFPFLIKGWRFGRPAATVFLAAYIAYIGALTLA